MKLISMHVDGFGCLRNYDYNFEEGLNVVLHDNGWGKTTMAAFLKAMLYGYDAKRSKDINENERKRYLPWQGGKYGGSLDFEAGDVRYRIFRTFGETPRFDTAKILNLDTKATAKIPVDKIGETLFHLDASAFQRSVFINQNGLSINGAASSIHARLNSLVSQANDVAAYDGAVSSLTQQIKVYEKVGARGQLGVITRQIGEKEEIRNRLEREIVNQDAARSRISEIDTLLSSINKVLEEKTRKLDEVSGEAKKREAEKKLVDDINGRIAELQEQIEGIKDELGGLVPTSMEIDQVKRHAQTIESLKKQVSESERILDQLRMDYNVLLKRYDGIFPSSSQLDEIQNLYGELQGILGAGETVISESEAPEGYSMIKAAADDDPDFLQKLEKAVGSQITFHKMIRKLEVENQNLESDSKAWKEKTNRYALLRAETGRLQDAVKEQEAYHPEKAVPVIEKLEGIQKKQQELDVRKETLRSGALTQEQEEILKENPGELPEKAEGSEILKKYRNIVSLQAEIQGLTSRLDGEKSKAESLAASLAQLDTVKAMDTSAPEEPGKSSGTVLIGAGAAAAVIGVLLGILVMPVMFAVTVIGAILAVLGFVSNNNHKNKLQAYSAWQSAFAVNQEALRKKEDLLRQQETVQKAVSSLEQQITERQKALSSDEADVSAWFEKWGIGKEDQSEESITRLLEKAEAIQKLRMKQEVSASAKARIDNETAKLDSALTEVRTVYPEYSGMSVSETISILREKVNTYRITEGQLQAAEKNERKFLNDAKATREELSMPDSPKKAGLLTARDTTAADLKNRLGSVNSVLAILNLDADQEHIVQALREAEKLLNEYKRHADKVKDQEGRQKQKRQRIEVIQQKLTTALRPVGSRYQEMEIPERLGQIRREVGRAKQLAERIMDVESECKLLQERLDAAEKKVNSFISIYGQFTTDQESALPEIYEKAGKYRELISARQQLEKQRDTVGKENQDASNGAKFDVESGLRAEIDNLKKRRDALLIEYTQKADFIRQADQALERYPDLSQEIHDLYEQKQKDQQKVAILKRTIQLITRAKENLANRYLSKVEDLFNSYMHIWLNNDAVRGLLDIDFNVTIEEDNKVHVAQGYSTGYCDMIDFCMRLALVDTLFENEQPFLILDDPFVNLDADRLEKALELLNVMAANKQIIYFICHPIRAVETGDNSTSKEEFLKLAETTRQTISEHQAGASTRKKIERKSPKEMYKVVASSAGVPFRPAKPNYTITNSIFSMNFVLNDNAVIKNNSYELFFIDAKGHVLNERQLLEINNGKLSTERIRFSLNTRDDSGDSFELMVRESGQSDDYEVAARFPFKAKMAFTGTFSFDF